MYTALKGLLTDSKNARKSVHVASVSAEKTVRKHPRFKHRKNIDIPSVSVEKVVDFGKSPHTNHPLEMGTASCRRVVRCLPAVSGVEKSPHTSHLLCGAGILLFASLLSSASNNGLVPIGRLFKLRTLGLASGKKSHSLDRNDAGQTDFRVVLEVFAILNQTNHTNLASQQT